MCTTAVTAVPSVRVGASGIHVELNVLSLSEVDHLVNLVFNPAVCVLFVSKISLSPVDECADVASTPVCAILDCTCVKPVNTRLVYSDNSVSVCGDKSALLELASVGAVACPTSTTAVTGTVARVGV